MVSGTNKRQKTILSIWKVQKVQEEEVLKGYDFENPSLISNTNKLLFCLYLVPVIIAPVDSINEKRTPNAGNLSSGQNSLYLL
jgi:hypothetical protein